MCFRALLVPVLLLGTPLSWAQSVPAAKTGEQSEDHQPSIHGIRIGMTTPQVLDLMGGRMPDRRKDEKGEIIVYWKLEGGNILQVNFRQENYVSHIALQFKPPRPTNDFWLSPAKRQNVGTGYIPPSRDVAPGTPGLDATDKSGVGHAIATEGRSPRRAGSEERTQPHSSDPRWRVDYRASETADRERTVWLRELDEPKGYRIQISFLSTDKKQMGDRFEEQIEYKYVSVNRSDLKKFDQAITGEK